MKVVNRRSFAYLAIFLILGAAIVGAFDVAVRAQSNDCYTSEIYWTPQANPILECLDDKIDSIPGAPPNELNDLDDVVLVNVVNGNVLRFNGTYWINVMSSGGASALDDLTDVILFSPVSGQALLYNGTHWINGALTVYQNNTASNLNPNVGVFAQKVGADLQFKSFIAGTGVGLSANSTNITVSNSAPESTTCTNSANGLGLCINNSITLKNLLAGTGVTLSANGTNITVTNASPESTTCSATASTGTLICESSGNVLLKRLLAGTGVSISNNATHITITNTSPESTACTNNGAGDGLCDGGNVALKSLIATGRLSIAANADDLTLSTTAEANDATNLGAGNGIYKAKSGETLQLKSLVAGTGISIANNANDLTITSTVVDTNACTNTGTGEAVCESANNINSLIAGTGITITDTTGDLTITNTVTDTNACTNTGTGEAVCESANNINSLIAGAGISITDTTGDLTIADTGSVLLCSDTIANADTSTGCTLSTSKRYLHVMAIVQTQTNTFTMGIQLNGDTATNYASRKSASGGADTTTTNAGNALLSSAFATGSIIIINCDIYNISSIEKVGECHLTQAINVDTTAPTREEATFMWDNSANAITSVLLMRNAGTGTFTATGGLVVYGHN